MATVETEPAFVFPENCVHEVSGLVHNFAFGSNLSAEKMESRGLKIQRSRNAILRNYKLSFSQLGFPPVEPSFANIGQFSSAQFKQLSPVQATQPSSTQPSY